MKIKTNEPISEWIRVAIFLVFGFGMLIAAHFQDLVVMALCFLGLIVNLEAVLREG